MVVNPVKLKMSTNNYTPQSFIYKGQKKVLNGFKDTDSGLRDGSAVKCAHCASKGSEFNS